MYLGLWRAPCLFLRTLQQRQEQDKGSPPPGLGLPSLASWEPASRLHASCSSAQRSQATGQASAFGTTPTRQMWTLKGLQPTRIPPPTHPKKKKQGKQPLPCPACCLLAQDLCLHCHTRSQRQGRGESIESPKGDTCLQELNTGDCNVTSD